jgi:hypothetical protein
MSASSSLMMVLGSCQEKKHHLLISDTLMQLKRDVCTVREREGGREGERGGRREGGGDVILYIFYLFHRIFSL